MKKLDNPIRRRIDEAIVQNLSQNPYDSKRVSAQEHKGKRIHRVGDYRIIFAICEECRKSGFNVILRCFECKKHGINDLILFSVSHRSVVYEDF